MNLPASGLTPSPAARVVSQRGSRLTSSAKKSSIPSFIFSTKSEFLIKVDMNLHGLRSPPLPLSHPLLPPPRCTDPHIPSLHVCPPRRGQLQHSDPPLSLSPKHFFHISPLNIRVPLSSCTLFPAPRVRTEMWMCVSTREESHALDLKWFTRGWAFSVLTLYPSTKCKEGTWHP